MRSSLRLAVLSSLLIAGAARAQAGTVAVAAPESIVHTAPFDVAPELARVRRGDKLAGELDAQSGWLRIRLPDGRQGFLHASDARFTAPPVVQAPAPAPAESPAPAASSEPPPTVAAGVNPALSGQGPISLGLAFSLLPAGTLTTSTQGSTTDTDADVTGALAPFVDVPMTPWLAVGFSPQFVLKLKAPAATQSWTEYDLHARLTLFDPLASDRRLYARLSPGYSILSPPSGTLPSGVSDPAGFVLDLSVGGEAPFGPDAKLVVEIGYQIGFQGTSVSGQNLDARTRFLHVGFGFALGL